MCQDDGRDLYIVWKMSAIVWYGSVHVRKYEYIPQHGRTLQIFKYSHCLNQFRISFDMEQFSIFYLISNRHIVLSWSGVVVIYEKDINPSKPSLIRTKRRREKKKKPLYRQKIHVRPSNMWFISKTDLQVNMHVYINNIYNTKLY